MRRTSACHAPAAGLVLILLAISVSPAPAARRHLSDAPDPEWREGPIRYIITKSEDQEYKSLDSEEDRRKAIEAFWRRRDPTPDTPGNEFRARFWRRVREANGLYGKETTRPGWLTDMGKIHILFGAPDEVSTDAMPEGHRGIVVWTYRNTPSVGGEPVLAGPNQVIAFAMDGTGEYRLTTEPSKVADVWEGLPNPQPIMGLNKFFLAQQALARQTAEAMLNLSDPVIRAHGGPPSEGPLGLSMVLARLQQPPKEWDLRAEITTREFFGSLPFKARADFFKTSAADAQVLLSIALRSSSVTYESTPSGDRPAVKVYARVLDSTATELVRSLEGELDFEPSPANGKAGLDDDLVYQGRVDLPPGSYVARLTVLDEESSRTATSDTPFTVPDFGEPGLSLSTIALAAGLEQADPGDAPAVAPYRFGSIRVIPRLGQDYLPRESMSFYYQVYGAARDPATGKPKLDVTYAFLAVGAEELQEIGEVVFEGQETEAHGYTLPLQDWPAGRYLLRIEIDDRVAGSSATREVAFRVLEGP